MVKNNSKITMRIKLNDNVHIIERTSTGFQYYDDFGKSISGETKELGLYVRTNKGFKFGCGVGSIEQAKKLAPSLFPQYF